MMLTKGHTKCAQIHLSCRVLRKDKFPYNSVANIFGYLNYMNINVLEEATIFESMDMGEMMFTSGLSQFLESRSIRYDISNKNCPNLRDEERFKQGAVSGLKKLVEKDSDEWIEEYFEKKKTNPQLSLEDVPRTKVVVETNPWKIMETCPEGYSYVNFLEDIHLIWTSLRMNGELNTSLKSAMAGVNLMSIVDKISINGMVKWNGILSDAFIPYHIKSVELGLDLNQYNMDEVDMIEQYFSRFIVDVFTK